MQDRIARWAARHPTANQILVVLVTLGLALDLAFGKTAPRIAPGWGNGPSASRIVAIYLAVLAGTFAFGPFVSRYLTAGPPPVVAMLNGEPATVIRRGAAQFAVAVTIAVSTALAAGLLAWLGFRASSYLIAVALAVGSAWMGSLGVLVAMRRYVPGNVSLTPTALTEDHLGVRVQVGWDDVASVLFDSSAVVVTMRRRNANRVQYRGWIWKSPLRPSTRRVYIGTRELGCRPGVLGHLIVHYARRRDAREELGTAASLDRIHALQRDCWRTHGVLPVAPAPTEAQA